MPSQMVDTVLPVRFIHLIDSVYVVSFFNIVCNNNIFPSELNKLLFVLAIYFSFPVTKLRITSSFFGVFNWYASHSPLPKVGSLKESTLLMYWILEFPSSMI